MHAENLKIDVFGAVGIATFILDCRFDAGGAPIRKINRCTLVLVKESKAKLLRPAAPAKGGS